MTREFSTLGDAYADGLRKILESGHVVPSVRDPSSKASNFGRADRPSRELLCDCFAVADPAACLLVLREDAPFRLHAPYAFGLLAWTLDGRNDLGTLSYYRAGATEYSDDEFTLSGAFGNRLVGLRGRANQIRAVCDRLEHDPAARRTFAVILDHRDNFRDSREYPCAVGIQLFVRDGRLSLLTVMRAQHALTVLPYDAFLFMMLQSYCAALLELPTGPYFHFSGTYHIYEDELMTARQIVDHPPATLNVAFGERGVSEANTFVAMEREIREAALGRDERALDGWRRRDLSGVLTLARDAFVSHALFRIAHE